MTEPFGDRVPPVADAAKREPFFMRRVIGGAFILGLALLGLAFPVII